MQVATKTMINYNGTNALGIKEHCIGCFQRVKSLRDKLLMHSDQLIALMNVSVPILKGTFILNTTNQCIGH